MSTLFLNLFIIFFNFLFYFRPSDHSVCSDDSEQQLIIDEEFEKDEEQDTFDKVELFPNAFSVREADSTNEEQIENFEEHRYDLFVAKKEIEIQVNKVDSEYSTEKILLQDERFPFKPFMTDFIPATEIFASISSHSIIEYKVRVFYFL